MKKNSKIFMGLLIVFGSPLFCNAQTTTVPDSIYPAPGKVIDYSTEWAKGHYPKRIAEFKSNPLQYGDIVFIGNSITEKGKDWATRFNMPIVKNRGVSGDVTEGVLQRLPEIYYFKPKAVFILIGINDLFQGKPADFVANTILKITAAIHKNSPLTKVFVQTILPTQTDTLTDKIRMVNETLKKNSTQYNYTLIDLHSLFMDDNDCMKDAYAVDGVHLNEEGYKLWTAKVKDLVVEAGK